MEKVLPLNKPKVQGYYSHMVAEKLHFLFNVQRFLPFHSWTFFAGCSASIIGDVVFLVDGSWSVGRPNFKYIRSFISAAAGAFHIGEEKTRVGVVQYSDDARTEFNLNEHQTRPALLRAIGSMPYKGGNTNTGDLLMLFSSLGFLWS